jgi:precorrin-4 methylase
MLHLGPLPDAHAHGAFVEEMRGYAELGIDRVMVMPGVEDPVAEVAALQPVAQALAEL